MKKLLALFVTIFTTLFVFGQNGANENLPFEQTEFSIAVKKAIINALD